MLGITIYTPDIKDMAQEAIERFQKYTGNPVMAWALPVHGDAFGETLNILARLDWEETVCFFDADLWFVNKVSLDHFEGTKKFHAVRDPMSEDPNVFPNHDCKVFGMNREFYFNSGIYIFTPKYWQKQFKQGINIYHDPGFRKGTKDFGEQTVTNMIAQSNTKAGCVVELLPAEFNFFPLALVESMLRQNPNEQAHVKNPIAVHAAGYGRRLNRHDLNEKYRALQYYSFKYSTDAPLL